MTDAEDLDAIAAALAQLRGRPRAPFGSGERGDGGRDGHPRHAGHGDHGGRDSHGDHGGHGGPPWSRGHTQGPFGPGPFGAGPFGPHARFGGGPARMRLLDALATASHPLSVSEVGEAIGVDQPRASRLIQQAVDLGLVQREADPADARRTRVALTDQGSRIVRGFRGERRERLQTALASFSPEERAELARLLTKLAGAWPAS
ncbi:MarR family winged helix-turn-helix transcriptional regulator [Microbacterium sp. LjRoot45]|uniref:MarR family winged helix-turn-helix transcriptional regulator n=1 Tax=Microbacterium sp. LjRoot45 TaxID=3342329 RepID=UPI003ED055DF